MPARIRTDGLNVWPAFTDTMLAFVLVLVVALAYQVARAVDVVEPVEVDWGEQKMVEDQESMRTRILEAGYEGVRVPPTRSIIQEITFGSDVTFVSGSATLNETGLALVKALAGTVVVGEDRVCTLREIQVNGHTDTVSTGSISYTNWELSANRALRVVRELIREGVDPTKIRMSATGYGEYQPRRSVDNLDENRRIELRLTYSNELSPADC